MRAIFSPHPPVEGEDLLLRTPFALPSPSSPQILPTVHCGDASGLSPLPTLSAIDLGLLRNVGFHIGGDAG